MLSRASPMKAAQLYAGMTTETSGAWGCAGRALMLCSCGKGLTSLRAPVRTAPTSRIVPTYRLESESLGRSGIMPRAVLGLGQDLGGDAISGLQCAFHPPRLGCVRSREVHPALDPRHQIARQLTDLLRAQGPGILVPADLGGRFAARQDAGKQFFYALLDSRYSGGAGERGEGDGRFPLSVNGEHASLCRREARMPDFPPVPGDAEAAPVRRQPGAIAQLQEHARRGLAAALFDDPPLVVRERRRDLDRLQRRVGHGAHYEVGAQPLVPTRRSEPDAHSGGVLSDGSDRGAVAYCAGQSIREGAREAVHPVPDAIPVRLDETVARKDARRARRGALRVPVKMACKNMVDIVRAEARCVGPQDGVPVSLANEVAGIRIHRVERESEMAYPRQRTGVHIGNARCARVGVDAVGEEGVAQGQGAPSRLFARLEHCDFQAGFREEVPRAETRQSGADDRNVACGPGCEVQLRQDILEESSRPELQATCGFGRAPEIACERSGQGFCHRASSETGARGQRRLGPARYHPFARYAGITARNDAKSMPSILLEADEILSG